MTQQRIASSSAHSIPTNDPQAALAFCRALAEALEHGTLDVPRYEHRPPLPPEISVVIPVYNEQENLLELYRRLSVVLGQLGSQYEFIFVDDGSRDRSIELLDEIAASDQRVIIVELARNFGHQTAISAGIEHSRGQGVIIMDADLQDPPEVLPQFIAKWREGYEVVYAIREQRKENWFKRTSYALFYRLLQRVAQVEIPLDAGDFCIMDRRVVDVLVGMPERNRFVRGMRSWIGLKQMGLAYERHARHAGRPKYTYTRLMALALDGLVSFSFLPLRVITAIGFVVSMLSFALALLYAIQRAAFGLNPPGFPTVIVAVFFLAGIQLLTIGVIGEYVGRIFDEVKRRPLYIVRRVLGTTPPRRIHDRRMG